MITRTETVPAPPYHCAICRIQSADYFIDTQVQTDEGAMFICSNCFAEMVRVSGEYIRTEVLESEVAEEKVKAKNNAALVEKFTRADRILKNGFGLDYGSLISLGEGATRISDQSTQIREGQAYLDGLSKEIEERQKILDSYTSQIVAADAIITEKLKEVDILNLPLDARMEAYHGSIGTVSASISGESGEDGGVVQPDSPEPSGAVEADTVSF